MYAAVALASPNEITVIDGILQDLMHDALGDPSLSLAVGQPLLVHSLDDLEQGVVPGCVLLEELHDERSDDRVGGDGPFSI